MVYTLMTAMNAIELEIFSLGMYVVYSNENI